MSTLKVTNILSNTASTPPAVKDSAGTEIGTFCRAWVNFNGTGTVAIRASFNVSSITDNGTGDYTVNFTNAMPDADYSVVISNTIPTGYSSHVSGAIAANRTGTAVQAPTASTIRASFCATSSGAAVDISYVTFSVFR